MTTLLLDDGFQHANATGLPTTPAVGAANGWVDVHGGVASIVSNEAYLSASSGSSYTTDFVSRPEAASDQKVVLIGDANGGGQAVLACCARYKAGGGFYWASARFGEGSFRIWYTSSGGALSLLLNSTISGTAGHYYSLEFSAVGTTLTATVYDLGTTAPAQTGAIPSGTQVAQITATDAHLDGAVNNGMALLADTSGPTGVNTKLRRVLFYDLNGGTLITGNLSASSSSPSQIGLAITRVTGGTGPYSSQLQRSTTSGGPFAPIGSPVSSATGAASFTDSSVTAGATYYYQVVVTDAASTKATSGVVAQVASYPALVGGTASASGATATSVSATVGAATGGSGSYAYAWYAARTPLFSPGDAGVVSAGTGPSITYAPAGGQPGDLWYLKCRTTDAAAGQSAVSRNATTALLAKTAIVGYIGDSITVFNTTAQTCSTALSTLYGLRTTGSGTGTLNQAIGGKTTADWLPTGTILGPAVTALQAAGATHINLMLGTNDARNGIATAASQANLQAICTYLTTTAGFQRVVVHQTPWADPGRVPDASPDGFVAALAALIPVADAPCDGVKVFKGDRTVFRYLAANPSLLDTDGTHPTPTGSIWLGNAWAAAWGPALGFGVTATTALTGGRVFGQIKRGRN